MQIKFNPTITFQRQLKSGEEREYCDILQKGKEKLGSTGKSILIIPSASLPQAAENNTGTGSITSADGIRFIEFAKKYWGINEVQLLPCGQYHCHSENYPIYSGTSMDLGNHMIDIKSFVPKADFEKIVQNKSTDNRINYKNVVDINSPQEKILRNLHTNMPADLKAEFDNFKTRNCERLKTKSLYSALREIYNTSNYQHWNFVDKNLFDDRIIPIIERNKRITEITSLKGNTIDFYLFKQFLAEKSLAIAKEKLNKQGIKLNGDMICGFSFDEAWANPKAFIENATNSWNSPVLNFDVPEGEQLLREKVRFYAEHYDGVRIDASWTYSLQRIQDLKNGVINRKNYYDKYLNIIDDEFLKVKGSNYNLDNVMHEFIAAHEDFSMYSGSHLKPFVERRNKIFTSSSLSSDWGSNNAFLKRGWNKNHFIIGARNHDSKPFSNTEKQRSALSEILKIPMEQLENSLEFIKAKLAEPFGGYNNMLFFMDALGIEGKYKDNLDKALNYTAKVPSDYQKSYFEKLERGEGFNPMDALEKNFRAKGLDKTEPKLYKKIVKYKNILEGKEAEKTPWVKIGVGVICVCSILYGLYKYQKHCTNRLSS